MERDGTPHIKYFILIYYSGHGDISYATQRVCLFDDSEYPLESKIRNFKNENSKNCVVFGVFDACRNAFGEINDVQVRRELTRQRDQSQLNDRQGNFFLIFSSEPTKPTDSVGVTRALFNYLINQ